MFRSYLVMATIAGTRGQSQPQARDSHQPALLQDFIRSAQLSLIKFGALRLAFCVDVQVRINDLS